MEFENEKVYCLHNTGNNFETIFFSERNKDYFLAKIDKFIKPFAEVLYTSLQFNQFFIVIKTHNEIDLDLLPKNVGIMLGSYAKGVNIEQKRLGSLFRKGTKAFEKFSDFPTHIREKFSEFRKFFEPSRLVDFKESTLRFFKAVDESIVSKNMKHTERRLFEILKHPLGVICENYQRLVDEMNINQSKTPT